MRSAFAAVGLALLVAVALQGCGSDESPRADPKPSPTAKPTVPPGLDASAPKRPVKQAQAPESALAFGQYFARLVQYAVEVRDARVLYAEALNQPGCTNCTSVAKLITQLKKTEYWQRSEPVELGRFRAVAMQGGYRVKGPLTYPEVQDVLVDGEVVETVPAQAYRFWVDLQWDEKKGTWQVLDFIYGKKKG